MSEASTHANASGTVPYPYVSFKTLLGLLDKLGAGPIPPRIDKTVMDTYSGGTIAILLSTLRMLDLIDEEGNKTDLLESVIKDESIRKAHFRGFVEQTYADQLELGRQNGTAGQLLESFAAVKGTDTKRKAILFFLAACEYVGVTVSPHFKAPKQAAASAKRTTRGGKGATSDDVADVDPEPDTNRGPGERVDVDFGDLGTVSMTVNVKWLQLPDDTFTELRKIVKDLRALAPAPEDGDGEEEDDE